MGIEQLQWVLGLGRQVLGILSNRPLGFGVDVVESWVLVLRMIK